MHANAPAMAKEWEKETPKGAKLPKHAHSDVKEKAHKKAEKAGKE